jgi:hypothetical protein
MPPLPPSHRELVAGDLVYVLPLSRLVRFVGWTKTVEHGADGLRVVPLAEVEDLWTGQKVGRGFKLDELRV